jgi:hypothetical protein
MAVPPLRACSCVHDCQGLACGRVCPLHAHPARLHRPPTHQGRTHQSPPTPGVQWHKCRHARMGLPVCPVAVTTACSIGHSLHSQGRGGGYGCIPTPCPPNLTIPRLLQGPGQGCADSDVSRKTERKLSRPRHAQGRSASV